jgi:hypothetical protein
MLHRTLADLRARLVSLPASPRDRGHLRLIVCRHAPGNHEALERVELSPAHGVPGDSWNRDLPLNPDAQLAVMNIHVAALIANGQALTIPGDNLFVDLDISQGNLPAGTRLRVAGALLEVTAKPHNGCAKFAARFGHGALRFVNDAATRHLNLRGVYWRVVEAGEVAIHSPIEVLSRPGVSNR